MQNAYRYKTSTENSFNRALKALERFRSTRVREDQRQSVIEIQKFKTVETASLNRVLNGITGQMEDLEFDTESENNQKQAEPPSAKPPTHPKDQNQPPGEKPKISNRMNLRQS